MYVLVDGSDGTGKDTQAELLLRHLGPDTLLVKEPDSELPTGQLLRQMLRDGTYTEAHAALFLADRMAMLPRKVQPALDAGRDVVSIRSWMSTLVYQQEQGWPLDWLIELHRYLPCRASHLVILDLDPEIALQRVSNRPGHNEFYEKLDIQRRVRARYLDIASQVSRLMAPDGRVGVMDGSGTPEQVHTRIVEWLGAEV